MDEKRSPDSLQPAFEVQRPMVPIAGGDRGFPVRRIYCIGRNYAGHAREMGTDPTREPPFFFQKPADAVQYVAAGAVGEHPYPSLTKNYHHEVELVVALGRGGRDVAAASALDLVLGYAVGLDMTRRDLQRGMAELKKPWEIGKAGDHGAPIGPIVPAAQTGHLRAGAIWVKVNGETKQKGDLDEMIWSVAEQLERLSQAFELFPGDLVFTGTPEGVGPVVVGDVLECHVDGLPELKLRVVERR
jgi:fumarylpyruvate hydrolase